MLAGPQLAPLQHGLAARERDGLRWYAVIDAAADPSVVARARSARRRTQSLYTGGLALLTDKAAPFLVELALRDDFTAWLIAHGGSHWGILLQSAADFAEVRQHLRRFLVVAKPDGRTARFRFYDPRILRAFLPVCTPEEAAAFFGPIARMYAAQRDPTQWRSYTATAQQDVSGQQVNT